MAFSLLRSLYAGVKLTYQYNKKIVFTKLLLMVLLSCLSPAVLYLTQNLIDSVGNLQKMVQCVVVTAILLLLNPLLNYISRLMDIRLRANMFGSFSDRLLEQYVGIPYACFESKEYQDIMARISDAPQEKLIDIFLTTMSLLSNLIQTISYSLILLQISTGFPLFYYVTILALVWSNYKSILLFQKVIKKQTFEERQEKYLTQLLTSKNTLYELKIFNAVPYIFAKLEALVRGLYRERRLTTIRSDGYHAVSNGIMVLWILSSMAYLIYALFHGQIMMGLFISVLNASISAMALTEELSDNMAQMAQDAVEIDYFKAFMELPQGRSGGMESAERSSDAYIEFQNVSFRYPGTQVPVLQNLSFQIARGEHVALVGENGAGKSTVIKLLCGLYEPDSGDIFIEGVNIRQIPQENIKRYMGVIFQDYSKYELTLRENIALGNTLRMHEDQRIIESLRVFDERQLAAMELDTPLGKLENAGVDLSGGQWQRLAMARGYISDAPFMILDEPTASLDPIAENRLYEQFQSIMRDRGCIMISHRMASAKICDRILVLHEGAVLEAGTHEELMGRNGFYADLFRKQAMWYAEDGGAVC